MTMLAQWATMAVAGAAAISDMRETLMKHNGSRFLAAFLRYSNGGRLAPGGVDNGLSEVKIISAQ